VCASQRVIGTNRHHSVLIPSNVISVLIARHPLLRGLLVTGAGHGSLGHRARHESAESHSEIIVIYCARGRGWCEVAERKVVVEPGELLVIPSTTSPACGTSRSAPWTVYWVTATGELLAEYQAELGASVRSPKLTVGDDLQLVLLFNKILSRLAKGFSFPDVFNASTALAHLLACCIARPGDALEHRDGFQKIGRCIEFMSEHLDEPIKVSQLAAAANLSPAHFAVVFREQTGSAPREYLHLLRMHRARQWLTLTRMSLKEIASKLGYQDQFHFSRKFKGFTGVPPSHFRDRR
jgi:AraC family transcriptional regulator, arabinose operon regulatory protein